MSEEGVSDTRITCEPKTEETCPFKDQHEEIPVSDTDLTTEKSFSDVNQIDNNDCATKETKEQKKISEIPVKKNQNLKSSIPKLVSNRTPSTIGKPSMSTSNRRLESSLKTLLQKPQAKEKQLLVTNASKVKPSSAQKLNIKSTVKTSNQSNLLASQDASPTRIYISEKKKFESMLNELAGKQEEVLKIHSKLTNLKDKVSLTNKDMLFVRDIKLVDLRDMLYEKNAHMEGHIFTTFQNTSEGLLDLEKRLYDLPKTTVQFCEDLLNQREAVIKLLSDIKNSSMYENEGFSEELSKYIQKCNSQGAKKKYF